MLLPILIVPAAGLQAAFHIDLLALGQVLLANLGQVAPGHYVEPFGFLAALAVRRVPRAA